VKYLNIVSRNAQLARLTLSVVTAAACGTAGAANYQFSFLTGVGAVASYVADVNNVGQAAGSVTLPNPNFEDYMFSDMTAAAVWQAGALRTLTDPQPGYPTRATGINQAGAVVGNVYSGYSGARAGMVWRPDGTSSGFTTNENGFAFGVNSSGTVVGETYFVMAGYRSPVIWASTGASLLPTLGGQAGVARRINDGGVIVGNTDDANGQTLATVWRGEEAFGLGTLGGKGSFAAAINNAGQIVGSSGLASTGTHATLWSGDSVIDLGTLPGFVYSTALDINELGSAVGSAGFYFSESRAVLFAAGEVVDLNEYLGESARLAGWQLIRATGINDNGWIVGDAYNANSGQSRAFLLATPVPEPATYALWLIGGIAGLVLSRRLPLRGGRVEKLAAARRRSTLQFEIPGTLANGRVLPVLPSTTQAS